MPGVVSFVPNDKFLVTITTRMTDNPELSWDNVHELEAVASGVLDDLQLAAEALVHLQSSMSYAWTTIVQARVSTQEFDSHPYSPGSFADVTYNVPGARPSVTEKLDLKNVLWLDRVVPFGRRGKIFLRGCLEEGDVTAPDGHSVLAYPTGMSGLLSAGIASSGIYDYFEAGERPVRVYMTAPTYAVAVQSFAVHGVTTNKLRRKRKPRTP